MPCSTGCSKKRPRTDRSLSQYAVTIAGRCVVAPVPFAQEPPMSLDVGSVHGTSPFVPATPAAQAKLDAAAGRLAAISSAIAGLEAGLATIQQAIASLQAELAAERPPDPSTYYRDQRRQVGAPPHERLV